MDQTQDPNALSDDELQAVAKSGDASLMRRLTPDEKSRLQRLSAPPTRTRTWTDTAVDALPTIGGAIGGLAGGIGGTAALGLGTVPAAIGGAALGGAGGEGFRQAINSVRGVPSESLPGLPSTDSTTGAAANMAGQGLMQGALEGVGQAVGPALEAGGSAIYRGYLKPSLSRVNLPKAAQIVKDAISESLPVTAAGVSRARDLIGQLNGQVQTMLDNAPGRTVDLHEIATSVRDYANRMFNRAGRDPADFQAAMKVADRIDNHPSMALPSGQIGPRPAPIADLPTANTVKQDLQGAARDKFGVPGGTAETQTEKFASSQMRKGIEAQAPEVGPLNARTSRLIDVARSLNQAVGREGNQSAVNGVKTLAAVAGGGTEYAKRGDPIEAVTTAMALRAGMAPAVATRAAILAVKLGQKIPGAAAADVARAAMQVASEAEQQGAGVPQHQPQ